MSEREEKLYLYIDTESIDKPNSHSMASVERFLSYKDINVFEFFRTSFNTAHQNLVIINEYTEQKDIDDLKR